jgi:predicted aspartyl protease
MRRFRNTGILFALLIVTLLHSGCGAFPALLPGIGNVPASFLLPGGDAQLPFRFHGGYILVDVTINDGQTHHFLLDTGASVSVVSPKVAASLPENIVGSTSIVSSVDPNSIDTRFILVDRLQLGSVVLERFQAAILPSLAVRSGDETIIADGILGVPLFRNVSLTVDYPGQSLRLQETPLPEGDDCTILSTRAGPGELPSLALDVAGRDVLAIIDTGNNELLLLPSRFGDLPFTGPTQVGIASTVTGVVATTQGTLDGSIRMSPCIQFDAPSITLGGSIASLGARAFLGRTVTLDQRSGRFWFQPAIR